MVPSGPAQVQTCDVGSRPTPGGSPAFSGESRRKERRGLRPLDPGFLLPLVPTRWILRWLCLDRSQGCYFRHTNPDLERIFREEYAEKHFLKEGFQVRG